MPTMWPRRHVVRMLLLGATAAVTVPTSLVIAQQGEAGTKVADLVHAGDFDGAATAMRMLVDERPLDRGRRLILGELCFGGGNFAAASDEFQRIEKRGGTKDDFKVLDIGEAMAIGSSDKAAMLAGSRFQDSASWLYLSLFRKGAVQPGLSAGPKESIRNMLRGDTTKAEYIDLQSRTIDALLDGVAKRYGQAAEVGDMVKVAKRNLRAELTCVAEFALGEQALGRNDRKGASKHFQSALDTQALRIAEFHIAKAELRRLA